MPFQKGHKINKKNLDLGEIKDLYINQKKSAPKISRILGVSPQTIIRRLQEFGIRIRKNNEYKVSKKTREKMRKASKGKTYEERYGIEKAKELKKLRSLVMKGVSKSKEHIEKMRKREVTWGDKISKNAKRLYKEGKLSKFIGAKGKDNLMFGRKGKLNPNWNNGSSFEPYGREFNKELKEQIRFRDNYICQECGKIQEELKRLLDVHHIDYNKQNNSSLNLISLCTKCHMKTNGDRLHWKNYFKMKMFIRELFNPQNILIFNENKQLIGVDFIKE